MSPKTPRANVLTGHTIVRTTHCGKIFVTVNVSDGKPCEVFIRFGKAGGCGSAMGDGIARLLSYGLRSGLEPADAVKALTGIGCHHGPKTCMHEVSEAMRLVIKHMETGCDLNEIIENEELAEANAQSY